MLPTRGRASAPTCFSPPAILRAILADLSVRTPRGLTYTFRAHPGIGAEEHPVGGFVDFSCKHCRYEQPDIGVGRGKRAYPYLALLRCAGCKCIGSTWIYEDGVAKCGICYHDAPVLLPDDTRQLDCPRCGKPATLTPKEGSWE